MIIQQTFQDARMRAMRILQIVSHLESACDREAARMRLGDAINNAELLHQSLLCLERLHQIGNDLHPRPGDDALPF